jgi:(p)ppGpp synthase/HD superfamily hydrolase
MNDTEIDADEAEIVRIVSRIPEFAWLDNAELSKIRHEIRHTIAKVLQEYYLEKTQNLDPVWSIRFKEAGITDNEGKSAISSARRLGIKLD